MNFLHIEMCSFLLQCRGSTGGWSGGGVLMILPQFVSIYICQVSTCSSQVPSPFFDVAVPVFPGSPTLPSPSILSMYLTSAPVCPLTSPNHLSFLLLTIFTRLSFSQIHPSILDRISEFVSSIVMCAMFR